MSKQFCLLLVLFLFAKPFHAQTSPELILDGIIGSPLQGQITWLDDERLLVGTSIETRLYEPASSLEAIYSIPEGGNYFLMNDEIIVGGQRWDSTTGEALGTSNVIKTWANEAGSLRANLLNDGRAEIIGETVHELPIPEGYTFSNIVFSPDESNAVLVFHHDSYFCCGDDIVQLWNLSSFEKIADLPLDLELVGEISFFQNGERLLIHSFDEDGYFSAMGFWDTATGELLAMPNNYGVSVISPDTRWVASYDYRGIYLWGMGFMGLIERPNRCGECDAYDDFAFSPDSRFLLGIYSDGIDVWNLSELGENQIPESPIRSIPNNFAARHILFLPDGQRFLSYSGETNSRIHLVDFATGEDLLSFPQQGSIQTLELSRDGQWLIANKSIIWDTNTWTESRQLPTNGIHNPSWTKSAYWDEADVMVHDGASGIIQRLTVIEDYRGAVVAMNANENWVAFQNKYLNVYDLHNDEQLLNYLLPHLTRVISNIDNSLLLSYLAQEQRYLTRVSMDGSSMETITTEVPYDFFGSVLFLEEENLISQIGGWHHFLFDANTGELLADAPSLSSQLFDQLVTPDGNLIIVAWDYFLYAIDPNHLVIDESLRYVPQGEYRYHQFSRDASISISDSGNYLALNQEICDFEEQDCPIYNIEILRINTSPSTPDDFAELLFSVPDVNHALFSPDSQFILTSTGLWSIDGTEIMALPNESAAFDPTGTWLVTYSENELFLWDWAQVQTGMAQALHTLSIEGVKRLAFNTDGSFLYAQRQGDVQRIRIQINSN
jgi:WD40 repeat protein